MIWLTWRQMRTQTIWTTGLLAAAAAYLLWLAWAIRDYYDLNVTNCTSECTADNARRLMSQQFELTLMLAGMLVIAVPAFIGAFWGAPLISRELETGTHRLAWTQTITRTHWLAVKVAIVGGTSILFSGALSLLLTWATEPYDAAVDARFTAFTFAARNLAPFGYAALAFSIGITVGLLTRRTLVAMAATMIAFLLFQILMATALRPHFAEPVTATYEFAEVHTVGSADTVGIGPDGAAVQGFLLPGAWVLTDTAPVVDSTGTQITMEQFEACEADGVTDMDECFTGLGATFTVQYQPADRYWTFQWIEVGIALALSGILLAIAFWKLPRGVN
jgi:hypothetical protein